MHYRKPTVTHKVVESEEDEEEDYPTVLYPNFDESEQEMGDGDAVDAAIEMMDLQVEAEAAAASKSESASPKPGPSEPAAAPSGSNGDVQKEEPTFAEESHTINMDEHGNFVLEDGKE